MDALPQDVIVFSSAFKYFREELTMAADAQREAKGAGPPLAQSRG